jgi:rod shape-determining protein MreD
MKVAFRVGVVMLSASVLQYGVLSQLPLLGVRADVLLLLAIAGGLALGPDRGAVVGFVAGLTFDLFLQSPLGLRALVFCVVGFVAGRYQLSVTRSSRRRLMVTTGLASALGYGLLVIVGWVLGQRNMLTDHLVAIIAVVSLVNALFAPVAVRVLRWAWDEPVRAAVGMGYGH